MTQVMRIMDGYGYPAMIWTVFIMLTRGQAQGRMPLPEGLAQSRLVLRTLDRLMPAAAEFLAGDALTLADTHTLPMPVYFAQTRSEGSHGGQECIHTCSTGGWAAHYTQKKEKKQ